MSNQEDRPVEVECVAAPAPGVEIMTPRDVPLGGPRAMRVRRTLPQRQRSLIGAWCFVDHYGPDDVAQTGGMSVAPHPHTGLQTVSWLLDGEINHRDTLGSNAVVVPGQLNLMTSGAGIAHSEESPSGHSAIMHGIQLWVALPEPERREAPRDFTQYSDLPVVERPGLRATVIIGSFEGVGSPATAYTPIAGVELSVEMLDGDVGVEIGLRPEFEYGVLAIDEGLVVEGQRLGASEIGYVGAGRDRLSLSTTARPARALLLGGQPFEEELVMWWNFIGRSHEEIVEFRRAWNEAPDQLFGEVVGYPGDRLMAPPMPNTRLKSRGRHR
jgi:hypothetical protein